MLKYKDFVPKEIEAPGLLNPGEHETFEDAIEACNQWLKQNPSVQLISLETVSYTHLTLPTILRV